MKVANKIQSFDFESHKKHRRNARNLQDFVTLSSFEVV